MNAPATDTDRAIVAQVIADIPDADALADRLTAFSDLLSLTVDTGGAPWYRPSIETCNRPHGVRLADAYDRVQALRGDPRRAFRSTCWLPSCSHCNPPTPAPRRPRRAPPVQTSLLLDGGGR